MLEIANTHTYICSGEPILTPDLLKTKDKLKTLDVHPQRLFNDTDISMSYFEPSVFNRSRVR